MILKKARLHQPLLQGIKEALEWIFIGGKKSDQVVPALLKAHPKWGSRDRSFVARNTYEIVRNKRLILHCLDHSGPPDEGILSRMIGAWLILKGEDEGFFDVEDPDTIKKRAQVSEPRLRFSMPDPLNDYMISELGEERWYKELEAMSSPADVYLRVNLKAVSREKLQAVLKEKGIETETVKEVDGALKLLKKANLTATEEFRKGAFEIQDAGSQLIAAFLEPVPGSVVIDACAGAGGKTLHLADLMGNKGKIIALDVEAAKLNELQARALRNKARIVSTALVTATTVNRYAAQADYLLLDVPCSGSGVIKRNPDAKEKLTEEFITAVRKVQESILRDYSAMLKPGGKMVYATCSLLPSENREQVAAFLEGNPSFELVKDRQIWPSETGFDGFYMALLQKK